jgi:transposase
MVRCDAFFLHKDDFDNLSKIVKKDLDWRKRERAQTLLSLHETKSASKTASAVGIHEKTVGLTKRDWLARKYESLVDRPRTGAPSKISSEQLQKIIEKAKSEPSSAKSLLTYHVEQGGEQVHPTTLMNALKTADFLWKRTRHSLKKTV